MRPDVLRRPEYKRAAILLHEQRLARFVGIPVLELRELDWPGLEEFADLMAAQDVVNASIARRNEQAERSKRPTQPLVSLGHYPEPQ